MLGEGMGAFWGCWLICWWCWGMNALLTSEIVDLTFSTDRIHWFTVFRYIVVTKSWVSHLILQRPIAQVSDGRMTFSLVAFASHSCLVDTNTKVQCCISRIPSLSTATTTCCRHHGHYPSDDELIEFDVMSTMSLRRPVRLLLFLSTTLWTDHPSSSRHRHCYHFLFSSQDEEETWPISHLYNTNAI